MNPTLGKLIAIVIAAGLGLGIGYAAGIGGAQILTPWGTVSLFFACALLAYLINWLAFVPAFTMQTEHFYDLTGSITYLTVIAFAVAFTTSWDARSQIATIMVVVWAVRLGSFLFRRIKKDGKDQRFDQIKTDGVRFFLTWTLQGLWVILTAACAIAIITSSSSKPIGVIGGIGILLWLLGFVIEVVADSQKSAFRQNAQNKGKFINTGLWSWSRHPNYFGEMTLWLGMAVLALPILEGWQYVTLISPLFVYLLISKVSGIPMLQKRGLEQWGDEPAYQDYLARTSLLFPLPPKKG